MSQYYEKEIKVLDINPSKLKAVLEKLGANKREVIKYKVSKEYENNIH